MFQNQQISLDVKDNVIKKVAEEGFDIQFGARPLKRSLQEIVEVPLSMKLLEGQFKEGDTITVALNNEGKVVFS